MATKITRTGGKTPLFCTTCGRIEFEGFAFGRWTVTHLHTMPDGRILCNRCSDVDPANYMAQKIVKDAVSSARAAVLARRTAPAPAPVTDTVDYDWLMTVAYPEAYDTLG